MSAYISHRYAMLAKNVIDLDSQGFSITTVGRVLSQKLSLTCANTDCYIIWSQRFITVCVL